MSQPAAGAIEDPSIGIGRATRAAIGRCFGTRTRRWLVAVTVLLGLLAAVALTAASPPADRTFINVSGPVQSLMSVTLPFLGVLLARDLRRAPHAARFAPTLLAAALLAVAVGVFGDLVCVVALAVAQDGAAEGRWDHAATVAVGGVLVQVVAQLVGTGLGLLLRPAVVACLATIVLPLGLWYLLGSVDALRPAQAWLTPFAVAQHLLSGRSGVVWAQWLVVLLLWGAGLNAVGLALLEGPRAHRAA